MGRWPGCIIPCHVICILYYLSRTLVNSCVSDQMARIAVDAVMSVADFETKDVNFELIKVGFIHFYPFRNFWSSLFCWTFLFLRTCFILLAWEPSVVQVHCSNSRRLSSLGLKSGFSYFKKFHCKKGQLRISKLS